MSGRISLGIIYGGVKSLANELTNITNYLVECKGQVVKVVFSRDSDGVYWVEDLHPNPNLDADMLVTAFNTSISFTSIHLCGNQYSAEVRVYKRDGYFGILIDFDDLIIYHGKTSLAEFEKVVANLLVNIYEASRYDYAFCDHEGEIEFPPLEFLSKEQEVYSMVALPDEDGGAPRLKTSSWHIDGLTARK